MIYGKRSRVKWRLLLALRGKIWPKITNFCIIGRTERLRKASERISSVLRTEMGITVHARSLVLAQNSQPEMFQFQVVSLSLKYSRVAKSQLDDAMCVLVRRCSLHLRCFRLRAAGPTAGHGSTQRPGAFNGNFGNHRSRSNRAEPSIFTLLGANVRIGPCDPKSARELPP